MFTLPDVEYLEIAHDLSNTSSAAVPRRLGFTEVLREQVTPPTAPSGSGIDVVWRLNRPTPPVNGTPCPEHPNPPSSAPVPSAPNETTS
jgi:hypothetical protein